MDGRITHLHRDREAIAHALILLPFISGRIQTQSGCGIAVATPLKRLFLPRDVAIDHVHMEQKPLPTRPGTRTALLCDGSYRSAAILKNSSYDLIFRLSESAYTSSVGPRNVIISSNFGLFADLSSQLNAFMPTIAAALMFSEDLGISSFLLPIHDVADAKEAEQLEHLTAALAAVNISLVHPLLGADFTHLSTFLPHVSFLEMFLAERHEHCRSPEDLADLWLARLLLAQSDENAEATKQAAAKLEAFAQAGHQFSPRENELIRAHR